MVKPLCYLATPFWHSNSEVRVARHKAAEQYTIKLLQEGRLVYSPIVHLYDLAEDLGWSEIELQDYDIQLLRHCDRLLIGCIPGYLQSKGVKRETSFARDHNIPVEMVHFPLGELEFSCRA